MRVPEPLKLSPDEQELLKLAEESEAFIQQPMWKKIEIFLKANVEEALEDMRGNQSTDPRVAHRFNLIWREREALKDSLIAFVKGPIREKRDLLDQIEQVTQAGIISQGGI